MPNRTHDDTLALLALLGVALTMLIVLAGRLLFGA